MFEIHVTYVNSIGVMALLGVIYGVILRRRYDTKMRNIILGIAFGIGAIAAMSQPMSVADGVLFDPGNLFLGFAGAFLGPVGAIIALAAAGTARFMAGGAGLFAALASMGFAMAVGLLWAHMVPRDTAARLENLLLLGAMIATSLSMAALLPAATRGAIMSQDGALLAGFMVLGAVLFGLFLDREWRNATRENALRKAACTDPLTGLCNRRGFTDAYESMQAAVTPGAGTALVMIDIDHFKRINDSYGHDVGDLVLKGFARVLRKSARKGDVVARLGGEEFAVLLPDTAPGIAYAFSERLRRKVEALTFALNGTPLRVTASFGVHWEKTPNALDGILKLADTALYQAKANGRNRVEVYSLHADVA